MVSKILISLSVTLALIQAAFGQVIRPACAGNPLVELPVNGLPNYPGLAGFPGNNPGLPYGNLGYGLPDLNIGSSGPLIVQSISPIGPSGLAVASENVIEGVLQVNGALPFLSAVSFEGALPTAGSGVATCGCGNGAVGILSEGFPGPIPGPFPGPMGPQPVPRRF